jgi:hypothetical protein
MRRIVRPGLGDPAELGSCYTIFVGKSLVQNPRRGLPIEKFLVAGLRGESMQPDRHFPDALTERHQSR